MGNPTCPCIMCEIAFERGEARYVGRWKDGHTMLDEYYGGGSMGSSDVVPFREAMVFSKKHALTFGTNGRGRFADGGVRLVPRRLRRIRMGAG